MSWIRIKIFLVSIVVSGVVLASENPVETFNRLYRNGDYKHALKKLHNERARAKGDDQVSKLRRAQTYFEEGLIALEFNSTTLQPSEELFNKGFELAESSDEVTIEGQILFSRLYRKFGLFTKSDSILDLIDISETHPSFFRKHHELVLLHYGQGKYTSALAEIKKEEKHYLDKIESDNSKPDKRSKEEKAKINRGYADLRNLEAQILLDQGNVKEADKIIRENNFWLLEHDSKKDIAYLDNLYLQGVYEMKNNDWNDAYHKFEKFIIQVSNTKYGWKYKEQSDAYFKTLKGIVVSLYNNNRALEATHYLNDYSSRIKRYFGLESKKSLQVELLELEQLILDKEYQQAYELTKVLEVQFHSYPELHPFRKELLYNEYQILIKIDHIKEAEDKLAEIIGVSAVQYNNSSPNHHIDKIEQAIYLSNYTNELGVASQIFEESFENTVSGEIEPYHPYYFSTLNEMARLRVLQDKFDDAVAILKPAKSEARKAFGTHDYRYAAQLSAYAELLISRGEYAQAYEVLSESEEIFESNSYNKTRDEFAASLRNQAKLFILMGSYNDAKDKLDYAKQILNRYSENNSDIIEFAQLYIEQGEFHKTEKVLMNALENSKATFGEEYGGLIQLYNDFSMLYLIGGEYINAEKYSQKALDLSKQLYGDKSFKFAQSLNRKGEVHLAFGDYEVAKDLFSKAYAIHVNVFGENHLTVAEVLMNLGMAEYTEHNDIAQIEERFEDALRIIKISFNEVGDSTDSYGENNPFYADALKNLAFYQIEHGKLDEADKGLAKANEIWLKKSRLGRRNINSADVLLLRGGIAKLKGDYEKAIDLYSKSANYYKRIFSLYHPKYAYALSKLGQVYYINGDTKKAISTLNNTTGLYLTFIQTYFPSLSDREKNKYWSLIKNDFEFFNTLAMELGDENPELIEQAYNNTLATKALLLNSSIKIRESILSSGDQNLIALFDAWVEQRELLVAALSMSEEEKRSKMINTSGIQTELNRLEKELSSNSSSFSKRENRNKYTWEDVRKELKQDEVAIEIVRFRKYKNDFTDEIHYAAYIVSPSTEKAPKMVVLKDGNFLETKLLSYYKNTMKLNIVDGLAYEHYWKPIAPYVDGKKKVYLSLDGVYNLINVETLMNDSGGYLIDQHLISVVSNTKDVITKENSKVEIPKAFFVGNPAFYPSDKTVDGKKKVPTLKGAEEEVLLLAKLLEENRTVSKSLIGDAATEEVLKEELKSFMPDVFHIATHGFFMDYSIQQGSEALALNDAKMLENPLYKSGLMLANAGFIINDEGANYQNYNKVDGILTAYEVMNLRLDSVDVVFLSACETGLGKVESGEGVYGLQRAFLVAGADNVIMTLFKVSDEVTVELAQGVYTYIVGGDNWREAFIKAKRDIRDKYADPIYWGAFVMIGN